MNYATWNMIVVGCRLLKCIMMTAGFGEIVLFGMYLSDFDLLLNKVRLITAFLACCYNIDKVLLRREKLFLKRMTNTIEERSKNLLTNFILWANCKLSSAHNLNLGGE